MAKIRCFLCGGRVSGGVCTECGMPQRQHAQNYYLNESSCDNGPLTHVHHEYEGTSKNTYANREHRKEKRSSYAKKERRKESGNPAAKLAAAVIVVVVILVVTSIIANVATSMVGIRGIISNLMSSFESEEVSFPEEIQNMFDSSHLEVDDSNYDYVMYELEGIGDIADEPLFAGYFVVGYNLPEGTYELEVLSGKGDIMVEDWDNGIYLYEFLDVEGEDGYKRISNLRLYNGAAIKVLGSVQMRLFCDNAGAEIPCIENPLGDTPDMRLLGGEMYQAGVDFPAGTYDFTLSGTYDYVDIFTLAEDTAILEDGETYDYEYENYIDCFFMVDPLLGETEGAIMEYDWALEEYASYVVNVTIEEGTYVRINDPENVLYMTPSAFVVPEEGVENGEYY